MSTASDPRGAASRQPAERLAAPAPAGPVTGRVRLGRRTKDLVKSLGPGDIAVLDHRNIDRMAADDLVASGVAAVLNNQPSSDGRYPNRGPLEIVEAGVRLVDFPDGDLFELLGEGEEIVLAGPVIRRGEEDVVAVGEELHLPQLIDRLDRQQGEVHAALAEFAENTVSHIRRESEILLGRIELPDVETVFRDRQVLIVVRGPSYRSDLQALQAYIGDVDPVLVGVDGGADAIVDAGHRPDMILGDMDSASDRALESGAELVVHAYQDGSAPGADRLDELGLPYSVVPSAGTSQDVAMLMAHEKGASLIVSVGAHFNLTEFLDKDRDGMSSTFLTRLRIGESLVDAKGVSRLYRPSPSLGSAITFLLAFLALAVVVILTSPALASLIEMLWLKLKITLGL